MSLPVVLLLLLMMTMQVYACLTDVCSERAVSQHQTVTVQRAAVTGAVTTTRTNRYAVRTAKTIRVSVIYVRTTVCR